MNKRAFSRGERALLGLGIVVPTVALLGFARISQVNTLPDLPAPTVVLPNPNAHDTLILAAQVEVGKLGAAEVSPSKSVKIKDQPLADRKALLAKNQQAISLVREALTQPYVQPPINSMKDTFPEFAKYRELARMLFFAGKTYEDLGQNAEAARCYVDAMALGMQIPHGGPLIGALVGMACEAIGRRGLWELSDKLDAKTARATVARLEQLEKGRVAFSETLLVEKRGSQLALREMLQMPPGEIVKAMIPSSDSPEETRTMQQATLRVGWDIFRYGKGKILRDNAAYMQALADNARLPYAPSRPEPPVPTDTLNQLFSPMFSQASFRDVATRTETDLLIVTLALRAHFVEHHSIAPKTLDELLMDGYLTSLPDDPFAGKPGQTFRYKLTTLYSVGPDSDDDNGRAIVSQKEGNKGKSLPSYVNLGDEGDFVARVNTY